MIIQRNVMTKLSPKMLVRVPALSLAFCKLPCGKRMEFQPTIVCFGVTNRIFTIESDRFAGDVTYDEWRGVSEPDMSIAICRAGKSDGLRIGVDRAASLQ